MGEVAIKQWRGLWLPANEEHLVDWMSKVSRIVNGKPTYQYHKYEAALALCNNRRVALDIGGNVGLWSMNMTNHFKEVHAFEPVNYYADIFEKNAPSAKLHRLALGSRAGTAKMINATNKSCGDVRISVKGDPAKEIIDTAEMVTLDSFGFENVDFIKIDCEGYELNVLLGARETILKNKPVIIVEQKRGHGKAFGISDDAAAKYLQNLGMKVNIVISDDYVMTW